MTGPAGTVAGLAVEGGRRVAVAESLTGGAVASALARAGDAGGWFCGGVVAYQLSTRRRVLGVEAGIDPCSAACASQMAAGVRDLLAADAAVSVTGVGGPDPEDGHDAGTVYIACATSDGSFWWRHDFEGSPDQVVAQSVRAAMEHLGDVLRDLMP